MTDSEQSASYLVVDAETGSRLAAARDPLAAEDKARACEQRGRRVAITRGAPFRPVAGPWERPDIPEGYRLLSPRPLAASTLRREPERWRAEASTFPEQWGRWGEGHLTANVAYACLDRGLVEIAVPIKGNRRPYLYRRTRS